MRAAQKDLEADQLEQGRFAVALQALQVEWEPSEIAESSARLQQLFAAEEKRVADASVLASLLAPLIGEYLRASLPAPFVAGPSESSTREKKPVVAKSHSSVLPTATPSVADFIEGMLVQDRLEAPRRVS